MTGKILCEEVTDLTNIVENDCIKIIDYDRIETGVQLRCRKPGDFFTFGKDQKRKSLSRYFIDEKSYGGGNPAAAFQLKKIVYGETMADM